MALFAVEVVTVAAVPKPIALVVVVVVFKPPNAGRDVGADKLKPDVVGLAPNSPPPAMKTLKH